MCLPESKKKKEKQKLARARQLESHSIVVFYDVLKPSLLFAVINAFVIDQCKDESHDVKEKHDFNKPFDECPKSNRLNNDQGT